MQVVADATKEIKNKKTGEMATYRTLSLVDADLAGTTLEAMVKLTIPHDDPMAPKNLAGSIITHTVRDISDNPFSGVGMRGDLLTIEGVIRFEPTKKPA